MFFSMESDKFFSQYNPRCMMNCHIDFAFLDGKHWSEFLLRDFINTERNCHRNSIIALHDCLPVEAAIADRIPNQRPTIVAHRAGWWAGDVWRTALLLKRKRPDLHMLTLDAKPTGLVLISNRIQKAVSSLRNWLTSRRRCMLGAWMKLALVPSSRSWPSNQRAQSRPLTRFAPGGSLAQSELASSHSAGRILRSFEVCSD